MALWVQNVTADYQRVGRQFVPRKLFHMPQTLRSTLLPLLLVLIVLSGCGSEQTEIQPTAPAITPEMDRFPSEDEYFNEQALAERYSLPLLQQYEEAHYQYQVYLSEVVNDPAEARTNQWWTAFDRIQEYLRYVHLQFSRPDEYEDIKIFSKLAFYSEDTAQAYRELSLGMDYLEQAITLTELYIQTGQADLSIAWLAWQNFKLANSHLQLGEPALHVVSSKLDFQYYTAAELLKSTVSQSESPKPEVKILHIDYEGTPSSREADERIVIANTKNIPVDLDGWQIEAEQSSSKYEFPEVTIEPYGSIQIYTNDYHSESGGFVFGLESPVWSNESDCGLLYDQQGILVSKYCYSNQGIRNASNLVSPTSWTFGLGDTQLQMLPKEVERLGDGYLIESLLIPDGSGLLVRTSLAVWYIPLSGSMEFELVDDATEYSSMALAHDNSTLALGDVTGRLVVKRIPTNETVAIRGGDKDYIRDLTWSPDDKYLVAVGLTGSVRVWDSQTWDTVYEADNGTAQLTWSPDGRYLAAAGIEGTVQVWKTGSWLTQFESNDELASGVRHYATKLVWSADSQFIAVSRASAVTVISLWFRSEFAVYDTEDSDIEVNSLSFSPDRNLLGIGLGDGRILAINGTTWHPAMTLTGHSSAIDSITWSSDGKLLFSRASDGTEHSWDVVKQIEVEIKQSDSSEYAVRSQDIVVSDTDDHRLRIQRRADGLVLKETDPFSGLSLSSMSANHQLLTIVEGLNRVHLVNSDLEQAFGQLDLDDDIYEAIVTSPDGTSLVASTTFEPPILLDTRTGKQMLTFTGATKWIDTIAWSPDSRLVAFASRDSSIELWDATTGIRVRSFEGIDGHVADLKFSPDGSYLAGGFLATLVRIWRVDNGAVVKDFTDFRLPVTSVSWSPDSLKLVMGSWDGTVQLYDLGNDHTSLTATYGTWVWVVAWSPNGKQVAIGRKDGIIDILAADSWEIIESFAGHIGGVRELMWASDKRLLSSGVDGTVRLWSANDY